MTLQKVDQRVLGAGTTVRFGLLLVLLLAASALLITKNLEWITDPHKNRLFCSLAGGLDPGASWQTAMRTGYSMDGTTSAWAACVQRYAPPIPLWAVAFGVVALTIIAGAFFWGIPAWKGRRSQVIALEDADIGGDLAPVLAELVQTAGLDLPISRFVINSGRATTNAVTFGRPGRPTICLDGGLVASRKTDPAGFRAVVLHELAHIRNGDITITYATVALWRAFLIAVLLPEIVLMGWALIAATKTADTQFATFTTILGGADRPVIIRELAQFAFLTVLIYLTRADILRSREIYADLDAVSWGADPGHWGTRHAAPARRAFDLFVELWRTHPRWDRRAESLTDPAVLFGIQPLPTFLTGAATIIVGNQVSDVYTTLLLPQTTTGAGAGWLPWVTALPITAIIGIALWRSVAHSVLTRRPPPSGVLIGLWLGVGLAVGELTLSRTDGNQWFPSHPEVLLLHVLAAVVITWWTVQSAELCIRAWRGRSLRLAMLVGLAAPYLAFAFWFGWWQEFGNEYATGSPADFQQSLQQMYPDLSSGHSGVVAVISPVYGVLLSLQVSPLILWAAMAMWLFPLLAWTVRPARAVPGWARKAMPDEPDPLLPSEALPSLRKPLRGALLGSLAGAAAIAAARVYLHSWQPPMDQRFGLYLLVYLSLLVVALVVAPVVAATVTAMISQRYRLLLAFAAAGMAEVVTFNAAFLLYATDGCLRPLNTLLDTCHWHYGRLTLFWGSPVQVIMPSVLGLGIFLAATVVLLVVTARWLVKRWLPAHRTAPLLPARHRWGRQRASIALVAIAAIGVAASALTAAGNLSGSRDSTPVNLEQIAPALADASAAPALRRIQLAAWLAYGGKDLFYRAIVTDGGNLDTALHAANIDPARINAPCADMTQVTRSAEAYFPIPDPVEQPIWSTMIDKLALAAADCQRAAQQRDSNLLNTALNEMTQVTPVSGWLYQRLQIKIHQL